MIFFQDSFKGKFEKFLLLTAGVVVVILVGANLSTICTGGDECVAKKIDVKREEKQAYLDRIAVIDEEIEAFKKQLTVGYAVEKLKSGDTKQVSKDILGFKANLHVVQQAYADTSDQGVTSSQDVSLSTEESKVTPLRYQAALTKIGSPYANVDIGAYCQDAGITQDRCDILVGIGHSESKSGTDFTSSTLPKAEAIRLGQEVYHNPVGIKLCREVPIVYRAPFSEDMISSSTECPEYSKKPDENGMWIQRYDNWEQFWITYVHQMKRGYLDKGATTAESISKCYVRGDCVTVKTDWVGRVKDFIAKI